MFSWIHTTVHVHCHHYIADDWTIRLVLQKCLNRLTALLLQLGGRRGLVPAAFLTEVTGSMAVGDKVHHYTCMDAYVHTCNLMLLTWNHISELEILFAGWCYFTWYFQGTEVMVQRIIDIICFIATVSVVLSILITTITDYYSLHSEHGGSLRLWPSQRLSQWQSGAGAKLQGRRRSDRLWQHSEWFSPSTLYLSYHWGLMAASHAAALNFGCTVTGSI